jgi:hypothetical protein
MELVVLLVVVVCILAYYGFMKSLETGAGMANKEVDYLSDVHMVSIAERTAKLGDRINDETVTKAAEVKARLTLLRSS